MFVIILVIGVVAIVALVIGVYQKNTNAMCTSNKRLDGKTVIVTGGTAGIGLEISVELARRGARTIVACPFRNEGDEAEAHIKKYSENDNVVYKHLDLASLESIRKFADDILATEKRLDILINNAGIGVPNDIVTSDGMNYIMQVNYFGTFLLTLLLLPLLRKSGQPTDPSRIVNTSSIAHWVGTSNLNILRRPNYFIIFRYYADSKFCLLLFAHELTKRLTGSNVVINSVEPGLVGTRIYLSFNKYIGKLLIYLLIILFKTPWQGAQTTLHVALDRQAGEISGKLFNNCQLSRAKSQAYNDRAAKELWEESVKLVKLKDIDLAKCFAAPLNEISKI